MKKYFNILAIAVALVSTTSALAQNKVVQGTVYDELGEPVIGASVQIPGTKIGTITDMDGNYKVEIPQGKKLTVSYIGYVSQQTTGGVVKLQEDRQSLEEVVVVGYGTQKMKNVTGAVEAISADDLKDLSVGSLADALVGQMNGVSVLSNGSRPGEAPSLQIRQSSVNAALTPSATNGGDPDPKPLYVIDDFISTEEAFNNLDVSEVESITVLKDASAAVYGSRAAYGVVLVKTKRGKIGAPKISYTGQLGWTDALYTPKMLSAYEYGRMWNAITAANTTTQENVDIATRLFQKDELEALKGVNYDLLDDNWKAALTQRHSLNISGGTEKSTYFANVSYYDQDGNMGRLSYDRWNFRAGITSKIGKYVNAAVQVSGDYGKKNNAIQVQGGGTDGDYMNLMAHLPFVPSSVNGYPIIYTGMENTTSNLSATQLYNFEAIQNSSDYTRNRTNNFNINGSLDFDFGFIEVLKGLHAKLSYQRTFSNSRTNSLKSEMNVYGLANRGGSSQHLYSWAGMDPATDYAYSNLNVFTLNNGNIVSADMGQSESYQFNFTINYARSFGKHDISALFSYERSESESYGLEGSRTSPYPFSDGTFASAYGTKDTGNSISESGIASYIGRLNYAYANKYLLEFLIRSDASTKFAPENFWGVFPSVSVGWVLSEEEWFQKALPWVNFLKIRGSWGMLGRDNIQAWLWTQKYGYKAEAAKLGTDPTASVGDAFTLPAKGVNRDVHWDKNYKTNFGIDARFLDGRLSVDFNYYYDRGRDMFMTYTGTSMYPTTVGTQATPENYGKVDTWGWELNLGWRDKIGKDINYWVKLSTGYSDNKILAANFPATPEFDSIVEGERQDRGVWGYKCLGIFTSYQQIQEYFTQNNITSYLGNSINDVHPGMLIYADTHGDNDGKGNYGGPDGKVDKNDMIQLSKYSNNPYGCTLNLGGSYKDFSISAQFSASWGAYQLVNGDFRQSFNRNGYGVEYFNQPSCWSDMFVYQDIYDKEGNVTVARNIDAAYPNMAYASQNSQASSFWLVNAAQITLRNISVAWTMPKAWVKYVGLSNVRWNLTVQNALYLLNPYPDKSWAPYAGSYGRYPNLRKVTLGVNVSF